MSATHPIQPQSTVQAQFQQASRSQKVLVVRVSFRNQGFKFSADDFSQLMFSTDTGVSSVANYYLDNSYGDYLLQPATETQGSANDGIVDVTLAYDHPDFGDGYGNESNKLVKDALNNAKESIDFVSYDVNGNNLLEVTELAVILLVAGYEQAFSGNEGLNPRVWAHQKEIDLTLDAMRLPNYAMFGEIHQHNGKDKLATIGIITHELGHLLFALPDLYDRAGKSNGIGEWGLMGLGTWNKHPDIAEGRDGGSPAHMMVWSKMKAGFLKPKDVEGSELESNEQAFTLASASYRDSDSEKPMALRLWVDPFRHSESFIVELRSDAGFDRGLPGHGVLISHIDEWVGYGRVGTQNDDPDYKLVDIEEADGNTRLDRALSRGDSADAFKTSPGNDYFDFSTTPNSNDYQGSLSGVAVSNIKISAVGENALGEIAEGLVAVPYQKLAYNFGYDDGGVGSKFAAASLVAQNPTSLIAFELGSNGEWLHGIDIYSHGAGRVIVSLYSNFAEGVPSNPLLENVEHEVVAGWNRIAFEQALSVFANDEVYLQVQTTVTSDSSDSNSRVETIFSVDKHGEVSGRSYLQTDNGAALLFETVDFDFNQRLLLAEQKQPFKYVPPRPKTPEELGIISRTSAGAFGLLLIALFSLCAITLRSKCA